MTAQDKRRITRALHGKKVLVLGDVMLDEYIWGDVNRISPEAPVPVVELRRRSYVCGGAGNVAANIVSLGGEPILSAVVGEDPEGFQLRTLLTDSRIGIEGLVADASRPTTTKVRVIAHSQQVLRVDTERGSPISEQLASRIVTWVEKKMPEVDACAVSDYSKGVVSPAVAQGLINAAKKHNKPVVVDPKGLDYAKYRGATVITPNVKEAEAVLSRPIREEQDLCAAGRRLVELLDGNAILLTRGARGMSLFIASSEDIHIPAVAKNVYDVTGAGDTVVGVLSLCLATELSLTQAAQVANQAAGVVVGKVGTAAVTVEELLAS